MNVFAVLKRLDALLQPSVERAEQIYSTAHAAYRGVYISPQDAADLMQRPPAASLLYEPAAGDSPLPQMLGLSPFDMDVLVLALAPEIDLRYERLYGYLQDDVTRRLPTVDLALNILAPSAERIARRRHFLPDAPLIRRGIVHLVSDRPHVPLIGQGMRLDSRIVMELLGDRSSGKPQLDARLCSFCEIILPDTSPPLLTDTSAYETLRRLAQKASSAGEALLCYLHGRDTMRMQQTAQALARERGAPLLIVDIPRLLAVCAKQPVDDVIALFKRVMLEQALTESVLLWQQADMLADDDRQALLLPALKGMLDDAQAPCFLAGEADRPLYADWLPVAFDLPSFDQRRRYWRHYLEPAQIELSPWQLDALADRFVLAQEQIAKTASRVQNHIRWQDAGGTGDTVAFVEGDATLRMIFAAVREQNQQPNGVLMQRIQPVHDWSDLVLPDDALAQLRELCQRVENRQQVLERWQFGGKLASGRGVSAIFAGASGTGKTMAAGVIARVLGLDLYRVDLAGVVSKYIGETEKNLNTIFSMAERSGAVLFFDEADALFGKRTEVQSSHDRYANIETSYLLQKMEDYPGIAILATNLLDNIDAAFMRRLAFVIRFPMPDTPERCRIWQQIYPLDVPLGEDVDLEWMAQTFKLAGGHIKNIALGAAFLAAADRDALSLRHLLHATRREYQKMGKVMPDLDLPE